MAIFGKNRAQQSTGNGSTIIAADSQLVGNLTLNDRLHVDGHIEGDVQSESNVVIGKHGQVKGKIQAGTVVVSGRVDGSISATRLEIIAGGCVEGDVHIVDLVVEPGGRFNGSSEILASGTHETAKPSETGAGSSTEYADETASESARKETIRYFQRYVRQCFRQLADHRIRASRALSRQRPARRANGSGVRATAGEFFANARSLSFQIAQVKQLGSANPTAALYVD